MRVMEKQAAQTTSHDKDGSHNLGTRCLFCGL